MVAPLEIRLATVLPTVRIFALGHARLDPRWSVPLAEPSWRLYHHRNLGGQVRFTGPGLDLPAPNGAVVLIPPWCRVTGTCTGPVDQVYLGFDRTPLPDVWTQQHLQVPLILAPDPAWDAVLDAFRASALGPLPLLVHLRLQALVPTCLAAAVAGLPGAEQAAVDQALARCDPLAPALALLEADPAAPLDLTSLAAACGLSRTRFAHRFRERLGTTPGRWQTHQRIALAAQDLVAGDDSIDVIATRAGFANRFHFSRLFSRILGEGPAAYRSKRQHARIHRWLPIGNPPEA